MKSRLSVFCYILILLKIQLNCELIVNINESYDGLQISSDGVWKIKQIFKNKNNIVFVQNYHNYEVLDTILEFENKTFVIINDKFNELKCFDYIGYDDISYTKNYLGDETGYIVHTKWQYLSEIGKCILNSKNVFLFIVYELPESFNENNVKYEILQLFKGIWQNIGAFRISLTTGSIFVGFNPFVKKIYENGSQEYGDVFDVPENFDGNYNVKQFNGYSIRVDMFPSTYSLLQRNSNNKEIIEYIGVDGEINQILMEVLNLNCKYY